MPQTSVVTSSTTVDAYAASAPFVCTWKEGGSGAAWVHVAGELDLASSPRLAQTLGEALLDARLVVLDLRELTFMDASGVHVIVDSAGDARQAEKRLVLVRGAANVDRVLTLVGACEQVEIVDLDPAESPARALLHLAGSLSASSAAVSSRLT
jgi:anti-anti-sigma factor